MTRISRPATAPKLQIWFMELGKPTGVVHAYYNPREITIDKQSPWTEHPGAKTDSPEIEFTGAKPKSLSLELFFDTYETGENVHAKYITKLEKGTAVMAAKKGEKRRPPTCLITWGKGFPRFMGVMESLSVKYTMFFRDGTPCRAVATIKMKEVLRRNRDEADVPIEDHPESSRRRGRPGRASSRASGGA